jgi:hypothetical protein
LPCVVCSNAPSRTPQVLSPNFLAKPNTTHTLPRSSTPCLHVMQRISGSPPPTHPTSVVCNLASTVTATAHMSALWMVICSHLRSWIVWTLTIWVAEAWGWMGARTRGDGWWWSGCRVHGVYSALWGYGGMYTRGTHDIALRACLCGLYSSLLHLQLPKICSSDSSPITQ